MTASESDLSQRLETKEAATVAYFSHSNEVSVLNGTD